ncbi:Wzz/FepE/Etk N-terminal domain-containing protein [Neobacillus sp. FSL H8-0543]|uniref:YveK family protein n=1 Tax=Neobacillus sp. FSL H8-0543 TaxID=2954672 RepID=UPI00315870B6
MENEINIKKIFNLIKKRFWIIIITTIIFTAIGGIYSIYFTKPLYESSSRMIVNAEPTLMTTLMVMIKEPSFLENVVYEMNLDRTPEQLGQQISAGSIGGSTIVKISVTDSNPELATKIADTTANLFKREMPNLLGFSDISIFSEAKVSPHVINNNHEKKIIIGFLIGVISGIGLIFIIDFLDNTVRSEGSIEQLLGIPVLGSVSKMNKKNTARKKGETHKIEVRGESFGTFE